MHRRGGAGARLGLAVAAALAASCLAGTPLYVSSAGSAAVTGELAVTCPADVGLKLSSVGVPQEPIVALGAALHGVLPAALSHRSSIIVTDGSGATRRVVLLSRDGVATQVTPHLAPLATGEAAMSVTDLGQMGNIPLGTELHGTTIGGISDSNSAVTLRVTQSFQDIPNDPETDYWCGDRDLLRRTSQGDLPSPLAIVTPETQQIRLDPRVPPSIRFGLDTVEFDLDHRDWTLTAARHLEAQFRVVFARYEAILGGSALYRQATLLPDLVNRSASLQHAVATSIGPDRVAGVAVALVALLAAAVMLADERRRELRLLAQRGVPPWRTAVRLLPTVGVPLLVGTVVGGIGTYLAVRVLGPSPALERSAIVEAVVALIVLVVMCTGVAAACTAVVGDRMVDRPIRQRRLQWLPVELVPIAAAVISYHRLSSGSGVRLFGTQSRGGNLLAQGLPLLAAFAGVALLVRPTMWLVRRLRTTGARLPRSVRLGWRRAVLGPAVFATLFGATAIACACVAAAGVLRLSAQQQLVDKSTTFVGSDLSVSLIHPAPLPDWLRGRATAVELFKGHIAGETIDILGVDPATFRDAATLRGDASSLSLSGLLQRITSSTSSDGIAVPAIVVGQPFDTDPLVVNYATGEHAFDIHPVAHAGFFPGVQAGGRMLVVDVSVLRARVPNLSPSLWVRDPVPGTVQRLRDEGVEVRASHEASKVFDNNNHHALGWSYAPLAALGVLFAAAALAVQLLVDQARRSTRQAAHVIMQRRGFGALALFRASLVEIGVPTLSGAVLGVPLGVLGASVAVRHLDPIPDVPPPAVTVVPWATIALLAAVLVVVDLLVAASIVRTTTSADPMEVLRGVP